MKYGYDGISDEQVIKNYEKEDNVIYIYFLDGSHYEVPLTHRNELELQNIMLSQAKNRDESNALKKAKNTKRKIIISLLFEALLGTISCVAYGQDDDKSKVIATVLAGITGVSVLMSGIMYSIDNAEINELKKYGIYLKIKDKINSCQDPNLFNGVKCKVPVLNINTLDDFSLADIKQINANLSRSQMLYSHFNMNDTGRGIK